MFDAQCPAAFSSRKRGERRKKISLRPQRLCGESFLFVPTCPDWVLNRLNGRRDNLINALVRENIPVTFIEEVTALNAASLSEHQLLIILRDGMNWPDGYDKPHVKWMTDEQQQAIWDFVNRGGGFLALHNSQGLYPPGGLYYKLFGGDYGDRPKPYTFTIRIEDKNHPITAGVEDFEIFDEQHTVKYYLGREHLLLRSIAPDNLEAAAGWWREIGKGRFCYLAPGHTPDALGHPMVQRLIRNALRWLVRVD